MSAPFTIQTSTQEGTLRSLRDKHLTTLGGMLRLYYGNRKDGVTNDDENVSRECAAESTRTRD